jgi:AcrR family transcriptional regulator
MVKTITRNLTSKEQIRSAIIQAALKLFLDEGFEQVSMRKIADVIQYTPTTIYNYFQNKDELLQELFLMGFKQFNHALRVAFYESMDKSGKQQFSAILHAYIDFSLKYPEYHELIFSKNIHRVIQCLQMPSELIDKESYEGMFLLIQVLKRLLFEQQKNTDSAIEQAFLIWSAINGYTLSLLSLSKTVEAEVLQIHSTNFVNMLIDGAIHHMNGGN